MRQRRVCVLPLEEDGSAGRHCRALLEEEEEAEWRRSPATGRVKREPKCDGGMAGSRSEDG